MTRAASVAEISAGLGARAESFCRAYFSEGCRQGDYWQVGDTSGAAGRSLVKRVWIARDDDAAGERAAHTLSAKLGTVGIECRCLVPKLGDFNEDLLAFGKDALRSALLLAMKKQGFSD